MLGVASSTCAKGHLSELSTYSPSRGANRGCDEVAAEVGPPRQALFRDKLRSAGEDQLVELLGVDRRLQPELFLQPAMELPVDVQRLTAASCPV